MLSEWLIERHYNTPVFRSRFCSASINNQMMVPDFSLSPTNRDSADTPLKSYFQSLVISALLVFLHVGLVSRAAAQSPNPVWQAQPSVVEMWSEKRAEHNFDESRVPDYELPDPLALEGGRTVRNKSEWLAKGRPALLQQFRENIYGVRPDTSYEIEYEEIGRRENAFGCLLYTSDAADE